MVALRRLPAFNDSRNVDNAKNLEVRAILKVDKAENDAIVVFKKKGSFLYSGLRDAGKLFRFGSSSRGESCSYF